jgi:hypothetical protein
VVANCSRDQSTAAITNHPSKPGYVPPHHGAPRRARWHPPEGMNSAAPMAVLAEL